MNEEHAIFWAQQLDLIYAQPRILYEIILNAPQSNFDAKLKLAPHADGIFVSASTKSVESITNQMNKLSIK